MIRERRERRRATPEGDTEMYTFQSEKWIEPLTEATVYPDTIWRERERNGESRKENQKQRKERENKERRKEKKEKTRHFTSFKVHSADNQALF